MCVLRNLIDKDNFKPLALFNLKLELKQHNHLLYKFPRRGPEFIIPKLDLDPKTSAKIFNWYYIGLLWTEFLFLQEFRFQLQNFLHFLVMAEV